MKGSETETGGTRMQSLPQTAYSIARERGSEMANYHLILKMIKSRYVHGE